MSGVSRSSARCRTSCRKSNSGHVHEAETEIDAGEDVARVVARRRRWRTPHEPGAPAGRRGRAPAPPSAGNIERMPWWCGCRPVSSVTQEGNVRGQRDVGAVEPRAVVGEGGEVGRGPANRVDRRAANRRRGRGHLGARRWGRRLRSGSRRRGARRRGRHRRSRQRRRGDDRRARRRAGHSFQREGGPARNTVTPTSARRTTPPGRSTSVASTWTVRLSPPRAYHASA